MARPPSTYHPLREIRSILGLTQKKFAETISIAPVTLKKIESGKLELSREVASRIFAETEVPLWRMDSKYLNRLGRDIPLTTWDGRPLLREYYQERKKQAALIPPERIKQVVDHLAFHIEVLLEAACESTNPNPQLVFFAIQSALNEIKEEFRLGDQVKTILAKYNSSWAPGWIGEVAGSRTKEQAELYSERKEKLDIKQRGISAKKPKRPVL